MNGVDDTSALYGTLDPLTHRTLVAVLRHLGGGRVGLDPARAAKGDLIAFARSTYGPVQVAAAVAEITLGAAPGAPAASVSNQPLPPAPVGPVEAVGAWPAAPIDDEADRGAAAALPTPPTPKEAPVTATADDAAALASMLRRVVGGAVDRAAVEEIIDDRFEALRPMLETLAAGAAKVLDVRTIQKPDGVKITGQHPLFEKVLRLAVAGVNVLLVGPAGCGKSHLAEQVAKALDRPFGSLSLTAGTSESALVGRLLPVGEGGRFGYVESPFARIYGGGGVFLLDELDAADANMLLVTNSATANGHIEIEQRAAGGLSTRVDRHADCVLLAAANTFGNGASAQYVGRGALDVATLDRWYVVSMTYDRDYEGRLFIGAGGDVEAFGQWVWKLRDSSETAGLRRIVSTRMIQKGTLALRAGVPLAEAKADLLAGWTSAELQKVGQA